MLQVTTAATEQATKHAFALLNAGRLPEAEQLFRRILAALPRQLEALHGLATVLMFTQRWTETLEVLDRAIALDPSSAPAHSNLGYTLQQLGRDEESVAACRRAVELQPRLWEGWDNLGNAFLNLCLWADADAALRRAIELAPTAAGPRNSRGIALRELGRVEEAIAEFDHAIRLRPQFPQALANLAFTLKDLARVPDALSAYRRAIAASESLPGHPYLASLHGDLLFTMHFDPDFAPGSAREEHVRWDEKHARPLATQKFSHANDPSPSRRLRIGYVSPDFREHCQSLFTLPLLSRHDHAQFEIFCYSAVRHPDATTARIRTCAAVWRDVLTLNDRQFAEMIHADQIDILVDLAMHMSGSRPLVFAHKPAPVQIAWLAYPGTTGQSAIDYRLTDPHLDPPGLHDDFYIEQSICLPETFWCYDPLTDEPAVNALPALASGHITFGCLNNFCKVNDHALALWSRVLAALPGSHLLLATPEGRHRQTIIEKLKTDPARIRFTPRVSRSDYLRLYHQIDLCLDTFPYNGHTTSLDALWMGVPVVSMFGQSAISRAGLSQMTNLGLPEFVAATPEEFTAAAIARASDLERLAELRSALRQRMRRSPLMDAPRFARNIENIYRDLWNRWRTSHADHANAPE